MSDRSRQLQQDRQRKLAARERRRLLGDGGLGGRSGLVAPTSRSRQSVSGATVSMPEPLTNGGQVLGQGRMLVLTTTTVESIAAGAGGDYVAFDTELYAQGFDGALSVDGTTVTWPADTVGRAQIEFAWDTYEGGGTIELEVDGIVPSWGTIVDGTSGAVAQWGIPIDIRAGSAVKLKVTHADGSAQTCDVTLRFEVQDPSRTPSGYEAVVLADGPVAYWRLDETAGTTVADYTGNGHTGTFMNAPTLGVDGLMADGLENTAVDFAGGFPTTGAGQHVAGLNWSDLEFLGSAPFSVECWFEWDAGTTALGLVVHARTVTGGRNGWNLSTEGGQIIASRENGASQQKVVYSIVAGTRYHVVMTYDGSLLRIYVDGAFRAFSSTAVSIPAHTAPLRIAAGDSGAASWGHFDGTIDEVAVYDRALTADEIAEHYAVGTRAA